jgi:formyl-CoA transferase
LELLPQFDVLVENFSLGTMERFGLGYETLKQIHPPLIYATVKGFGLSGPYKAFPSFEMIAQAVGGSFSVTGEPGGKPLKAGPATADTGSGMILMGGILAAYIQRQKTGRGQIVEVAQQETILNFTRTMFSLRERYEGGLVPRRGNRATVPTDLYPCAPGGSNDYVYLHVPARHMMDALMTTIGRPELVVDPRFETEDARAVHGDELWEIIAEWTRQRTKYEVMETLGAADVPCGAVLDTTDIFKDRHLLERGGVRTMHHPVRGDWDFPGPPVRLSDSRVELQPSPLLGEHTEEVLVEKLGLDSDSMQCLRESGVV